ncbi:hypothetical protein K493DRAFT_411366 [Basidiobolus meristosporus CBS 931.73]|uniref:FAS1 domain-containing protein n=1 Tax=Basidiobolus meristosporus CBS 931.73 TaxID=1314790 RepID=A0A1Y1XK07_9FUNG|nr:hypothetical protein K493DRAFT_411366 [Basidiobolus meristosporus CBS 931.73]|eukprot:ORX86091.1 hypothetical protein K493DRAFT_411366 [Basidiobolus meristosporus CBS 931.73]
MVNVQTVDGNTFTVDEALAKHSHYLKDHPEGKEPIRLTKVNGATFSKVLEYLEHHKEDPVFTLEDTKQQEFSEWDRQFVQVDQDAFKDNQSNLNSTHIKNSQAGWLSPRAQMKCDREFPLNAICQTQSLITIIPQDMPMSEVRSFFSLSSGEAVPPQNETPEKVADEEVEVEESAAQETEAQLTPSTSLNLSTDSDHCIHEGNETVLEVLGRDGRFSKFLQKINQHNSLEGDLGDPREEWTIFAPTDKAFSRLHKSHEKYSDEQLRKVLQYHVVQETLMEDEFETNSLIPTTFVSSRLDGHPQRLLIESYKNHYYINGVAIKETDLEARNGVVHVINEVILPPNRLLKQLKEISKEFSIFLKAVEKTGLEREFGESGVTGFIPTNYAFKSLGRKVLKHLFSSYGIVELRNLLLNHLSTKLIYSSDLKALLRRGNLGRKKGSRRNGDFDQPPKRGRGRNPPSRRGRRSRDDERGGRYPPRHRDGRDWDDEPESRYPHRRGGRRWDDEPEHGRHGRRWDDEPVDRHPPRRGGRHWDDEPEGRFPPRRGGRHWDDEPEGRFPPRRGGRRWDDEPEQRFPPRRGGRRWDDEPEERFPPRRGGRHWDDEPEERFPPRRRGRRWEDEPEERFPPRRGGRRWEDEPEERFPPRRGGRRWDDEPEQRFPPRRGGRNWDDEPEERLPPRRGGRRSDDYHEHNASVPDGQEGGLANNTSGGISHCNDSRRRSDSWDDLKEELANIEKRQAGAETREEEHLSGLGQEYIEENEETIYEVEFPSRLCGEKLELEVIDDEYQDEIEITVNKQARVLLADGVVENGVIHIIDSVLLPWGIRLPKLQWHDLQKHSF